MNFCIVWCSICEVWVFVLVYVVMKVFFRFIGMEIVRGILFLRGLGLVIFGFFLGVVLLIFSIVY
jgi:hypothetical protein